LPNIETELTKIFVFGTLKEGFPNFYLNKGIKQSGEFITENNYLFYLVGERHTPCIYEHENKGEAILGELYLVNNDQLSVLDTLERTHEEGGYIRTLINIQNINSKQKSEAYIYLKLASQINLSDIKLGPINRYTLKHTELYQYRTTTA